MVVAEIERRNNFDGIDSVAVSLFGHGVVANHGLQKKEREGKQTKNRS